jgi:hypothetical protein
VAGGHFGHIDPAASEFGQRPDFGWQRRWGRVDRARICSDPAFLLLLLHLGNGQRLIFSFGR